MSRHSTLRDFPGARWTTDPTSACDGDVLSFLPRARDAAHDRERLLLHRDSTTPTPTFQSDCKRYDHRLRARRLRGDLKGVLPPGELARASRFAGRARSTSAGRSAAMARGRESPHLRARGPPWVFASRCFDDTNLWPREGPTSRSLGASILLPIRTATWRAPSGPGSGPGDCSLARRPGGTWVDAHPVGARTLRDSSGGTPPR